ncbi:ImmA/IrrE family metallo-endopeptidase [Paenibacillus glucanolyticus]
MSRIADSFGVDLRYDTCKSFSDNEERFIILDKRESAISSSVRKIFFHELCHVLRHAGDQRKMPYLFKKAQEDEAEHFVLYASMPYFMISKLKFPDIRIDAINLLAATFKVPFKLAEKRLDQIQRREYEGNLLSSIMKFKNSQLSGPEPGSDKIETKIYAYFDSTGDYIEPSQIIIQVDQQTLLSEQEILFSLDGPFERLEESQLEAFVDCKPIKFNDLDYTRDRRISLKLSHLASRYYNSAFKFIVQRKDIEQVLHYYGAEF